MKKFLTIIFTVLFLLVVIAQEKVNILKTDSSIVEYPVAVLDSLRFENSETVLRVYKSDKTTEDFMLSEIDNIYFSGTPDTIGVMYSGSTVSIINPLAGKGVEVTTTGQDVVVNSSLTDNEVIYRLTGSSTTGSFKIYSTFRFELLMNGLNLTNNDGPAINIQSGKRVTVKLATGTTNTLADGTAYAVSTEDQKATFFSEGQLIFDGTGTLNVSSATKHAICSDDYIIIENGVINVPSAAKDAVHCNDKLLIHGGKATVSPTGDGFDCEMGHLTMTAGEVICTLAVSDTKGLKADSTVSVRGGKATFTQSGTATKGIKAGKAVNIADGTLIFNTTGGIVSTASGSGFDISYCSAIKSDLDVNISGGTITFIQSGVANKGISADGAINISGGTINSTNSGTGSTYKNISGVTDSYNATTLSSDGNISITGGAITTTNSGVAGKGISANGTLTIGGTIAEQPVMSITTTGGSFVVSGTDKALPKTVKSDGAMIINNGNITINSADDGLKSETSITFNGGTTNITKSTEGVESKIITMNDGSLYITASDDGINGTMSTKAGGVETNDGSNVYIKGGYILAKISGDSGGDAIDSNGNLTFTGGTAIAVGPSSGANEDFDVNGNFLGNGGFVLGTSSSSNMNETWNTSSTQYGLYLKSTTAVAKGTIFRVQDASGNEIFTFSNTLRASYGYHFSSSLLKTGMTYSILTGGSYTGGTQKDGRYSGGTYSGGTSKKTFTITAKNTTVTF